MMMPKTAVYKYYGMIPLQNDIGLAWQIFHIFSIPQAF